MVFGRCPRVLCEGEPVLPCGQSDQPKMNTVKFFCSRCQELYHPKLKKHSSNSFNSFFHLFNLFLLFIFILYYTLENNINNF